MFHFIFLCASLSLPLFQMMDRSVPMMAIVMEYCRLGNLFKMIKKVCSTFSLPHTFPPL